MPDSDNESGGPSNAELSSPREQDRFLPIANVSRIMKKTLPANAKISKDAKETVQECVSEFVSFITGEASDKCQREKRKTINGDDLLWAMTTLGFEDYIEPLKLYLHKFRDLEGDKVATGAAASSAQQQQPDTPRSAHNGAAVGYGMYGSGGSGVMMMMMGQPMYGSPPPENSQPPHHQMEMGSAKGAYGHGGGSPSGLGRQDRV
jgi:nuclear transcription Y subunit beta